MKHDDIELPRDRLVMITDTVNAERYATAFDLLDPIRRARTLPDPVWMVISENHDTHWLVVGIFRGFDNPAENGMNFMAFPKSRVSLEQVKERIRAYMPDNRFEINKDRPAE